MSERGSLKSNLIKETDSKRRRLRSVKLSSKFITVVAPAHKHGPCSYADVHCELIPQLSDGLKTLTVTGYEDTVESTTAWRPVV